MLGLECPSDIHHLVSELDNIRNKNYLTHGIHPYPAKFIPQIPACIIEAYSKPGDIILDPFCGSGTALVEGLLRSRPSIGIDLNPIATLISNVKTYVLDDIERSDLLSFADVVDLGIAETARNQNWPEEAVSVKDIPIFKNRDHWFKKHVQTELAWLLKNITLFKANERVKNVLRLCLSSILVKVSNQESDTRWKAIDKDIPTGDTLRIYRKKLGKIFLRLEELRRFIAGMWFTPKIITLKDVNDYNYSLTDESISLIVTSPPYANSYDYYLYHKLRMFWLGYDHKYVQELEIGSRNKHSDNNQGLDTFITPMKHIFGILVEKIKTNGRCVIVVGDSILSGKTIDMFSVYKDIIGSTMKLIDYSYYNQRRYSKSFTPNIKQGNKRTHIMVFSKGID